MNLFTKKTEQAAKKAYAAAQAGDYLAVKKLTDHGFCIGDCDEDGNSLLHFAVQGGSLEMVQYLVEKCNMDPTWANHQMETPYDLAHNHPQKCAEIEAYFAKWCGFTYEECYRNPVGRGMHADPSIICVGDDYYMVNSSFVYFPCIPISHSKDLVHWEVIGHAVTDEAWAKEHLGHLEGGRGFWAPDISYHNGKFYICATLRNNDDAEYIQTQMVTSSQTPEGPYDTPVIHNVLGIDPSIFTDDDGRRYMLINRGARMMEISEDGKEILSEPEMIWYGHSGRAPEGPHLLKKDGYYYCFLAEGGTGIGHRIAVGRSKNLWGPYEDCPYNPIMTQLDAIAPIQCCGHGKPVRLSDGRWYIVYLCSRYLEDKWGMLGRETCLDRMEWTPDGWPIVNRGKGPSYMAKLPFPDNKEEEDSLRTVYHSQIVYYTPRTRDYKYIPEWDGKRIIINGCGQDLCTQECRSVLVKNQPDFAFTFAYTMHISDENGLEGQSDAGVTLYYDENTYIKFGTDGTSVFVKEYVDNRYVREVKKEGTVTKDCQFKVVTDGLHREFYYNEELIAAWDDVTSICSEGLVKGKRFTGATYGVYVNGCGSAEFEEI